MLQEGHLCSSLQYAYPLRTSGYKEEPRESRKIGYSRNNVAATINVLAGTTVSLSIPTATATFGQSITLTAAVVAGSGGGTPAGNVTFLDGTTVLGSAKLDATGHASFSTVALPLGPQPITASYAGGTVDEPGASPATTVYVGDPRRGRLRRLGPRRPGRVLPLGRLGDRRTFYYLNFAASKFSTAVNPGYIINPPADYALVRTFGDSTDIPMAVDDGDGKADLAMYGLDPTTGRYRYDILLSSTGFNTSRAAYFDNGGQGYGYSLTLPTMADYEGTGRSDISVYQPDGFGDGIFVFQDAALGYGLGYEFADEVELPVDAPTYVLARKVRGQ